MKNCFHIISFLLITALASAQDNVVVSIPEAVNISNKGLDTLKKTLHNYVDDGQLAGIQTAILRKDKLIHYDSYGYADIENEKALNEKSIFRIFSMTKPITSVGLMQLYEKGKFKLEDPIHLYIPAFKNMFVYNERNEIVPAKHSIKIIDLLRHSSGISYGRSSNVDLNTKYTEADLGNSTNLEMFIKRLSSLPLLFEPGTNYEYGYSTDICGYLIEILSGQSLADYLQENILTPLKMKDTHFQLPEEKINFLTTGYGATNEGKTEVVELPEQSSFIKDVTFYRGGGGLVSTTNDYLNFCRMLLNKGSLFDHQILKPKTLELMFQDHLTSIRVHSPRLRIIQGETGFGLGFSIAEKDGRKVYGWGGAVGTYFRIEPEQDLAYIMMIQLSPYRQLKLRNKFQTLVHKAIIDKPKSTEPLKPILLDKAILSGSGLKQIDLKDQPNRVFFQTQLYEGKELSAYVISSSTATKNFKNFPIDEFVHLTKGNLSIQSEMVDIERISTNSFVVIPKGFEGNISTIGNPKYHLELSIVSNGRADKKLQSKRNQPFCIDKNILSGKGITLDTNGTYESIIFSGLELEIRTEAETPRNLFIENNASEKCIYVLEGAIQITLNNNEQFTFNAGEYFILPKGFKGTLSSIGKNLYRCISVNAKV